MRRPIAAGYVSAWTSIVGALAGTLRALGAEHAPAEVAVLSGHAFRFALTAAPEGRIGAGGPNAFAAGSATALYEGLGWRFSAFEAAADDAAYAANRAEALRLLRRSLDHGRSAIAFGLHLPQFGIVRGALGEDLIAGTAVSSQYGERLPAAQWPAPGRPLPIRVFLPERRVKVDPRAALAHALRFAVAYAGQGEAGAVVAEEPVEAAGLAAYRRWLAILESDAPIAAHGQAYCIQALQEARAQASTYLAGVASRSPEANALAAAVAAYQRERVALSQLATLFPYPNGGAAAAPGIRRAAAGSVRRALAAEEEAIAALDAATT
ncbi:MAG TPA: hypothetical protein VKV26_15975 [Dehalococcoidia bacterium]|nr:hypothetical protein [Dehalococcoidia bacterium]